MAVTVEEMMCLDVKPKKVCAPNKTSSHHDRCIFVNGSISATNHVLSNFKPAFAIIVAGAFTSSVLVADECSLNVRIQENKVARGQQRVGHVWGYYGSSLIVHQPWNLKHRFGESWIGVQEVVVDYVLVEKI